MNKPEQVSDEDDLARRIRELETEIRELRTRPGHQKGDWLLLIGVVCLAIIGTAVPISFCWFALVASSRPGANQEEIWEAPKIAAFFGSTLSAIFIGVVLAARFGQPQGGQTKGAGHKDRIDTKAKVKAKTEAESPFEPDIHDYG
jgi:hypothetical protein